MFVKNIQGDIPAKYVSTTGWLNNNEKCTSKKNQVWS